MRSTHGLTLFLIGSLLLCACHGKKDIRVLNKNFENEIELQQNLVFSLNKDIYPDTLLGRWDTTAFVEITPKVRGRFKWNSSNEVVFSPLEGFAPGAHYSARLTSRLLDYSKKKYSIDTDPMSFQTAPLRVSSAHVMWTRGKNVSNVMVQVDLGFNYEVDLKTALDKLKLSGGGNNISITGQNEGKGKVLSVQFNPLNDQDKETPLKIELNKGIPVPGSQYISEKDTTVSTNIPSRYDLEITEMNAQHTGTEGIVTLTTSQPVMERDLKSLITLVPVVPFEVTLTDDGFIVSSKEFSPNVTYQMNVSQKLEGAFGGKMKHEYSEQVIFGKIAPAITFINAKGTYLSSAGFKNLALNIVNVPVVEVKVVKVYENNLEQFIRKDRRDGYSYGGDDGGGEYGYYSTENLGDTIFSKTYETAKLPKQNAARILHLDIQDKLKSYNGVYVITVKSKDHEWVQDSKILSLSDIGLIVKEEKDKMYVFTNSIHNATPMSGVSINFIGTNNQKMYSATTDADGVVVYKDIAKQSPGFTVGMVTAKFGDEFTFISFEKARIGTSRFDVGGRTPNATGMNAMIYAERNLYRPGEVLHLSAVIRDEQWKVPGEIPVKMRLVMPNGKEFSTLRKILNEQGSCEVAFAVPATSMTGTYIAELYTGNDILLNSYRISVEEFMPDRMKVAASTDKEQYTPGIKVTAKIQADNLFGTPAAGRNYQCELNIEKKTFEPKNFDEFDFGLHADFSFNADARSGKTDDHGYAEQLFDLDMNQLTNQGLLMGNVSATVFDETGRPVHRYAHFPIYTQPLFIGIKGDEEYVSTRVPVKMGLVAVDKNGNAQSAEVDVVVIRKEWNTVIQQNGGTYRYVSQSVERVVSQQKIHISGTNSVFTTIPQQSGEYEVRVFYNGSNNYVVRRLYAWGYGDSQYTSFEVNNEGNVDIKGDKAQYDLGDDMKLLFTTPFDGRLLVTLERDHILKYYYMDAKNKSASLTVKSTEDHIPNIYVTATLIRPMAGDNMPLTVAHGFKSISVENKSNHIPLKIAAVEKSRSKTKQTIHLKTAPNAFVTVSAVDEGILQVKNFTTPDPYDFFYQKVALAVNSYDIYPWLLPEIKTTLSSTGGDESSGNSNRVNPMFANRVKLVSFWSGILQADGGGNVRYEVDIPQFSGDLRIMAYAYKDKAFGSLDQHMKVADPVVISTALPRFLSPKDEVVMPVSLSNTTNKEATATVTLQVTGPMGIKGESVQTVKLPANKESRVVYNIVAQSAIGVGKVTVTVKAMGETFTNETEMSVRPPASLQKQTGSGFAEGDTKTNIDMANNFIPSTVSGKIIIAKSPLAQFSKNLTYLVRYPYGCVEQTTSAAFPQLYYADLIKSATGRNDKESTPTYNVQQAINKLQSMQMFNGGLSYWPQGGYESWWGSVYACHFLIEAKKAGYEVNPTTLKLLLEYMKAKLVKKETVTFFYNDNQHKEVAPEEVAYSLYILAMAGEAQPGTMNYYKAHNDLLTLDSRYMLSAAYALSGQPKQAREVMPPAFSGEIATRSFSGSFYSYIRDEALSLNVLMDVDPTNAQVGVMTRHLTEQLKTEKYLTTQENVFSLLALGKVARRANATNATANVTIDGKVVGHTSGDAYVLSAKECVGKTVGVQVSGKGGFYYSWEMDGISTDGSYKEEDSYMKVRRTYYDKDGHEISNKTFKQNDLIVVRISVESQHNSDIENVAITDMLPAGFEIENTRLTEMPAMKWIQGESEPQYKDVRDDRINMFTTVSGKRRDFYYMVRAVSPGVYQLGPVQADAMYDGTYHSYYGGGVIRISEN